MSKDSKFVIVDSAVANQSSRNSIYAGLLSDLPLATKNAEGQYAGKAVAFDKVGQVLSLRAAAKVAGVGIVSRKQADGKTLCWKVNAADLKPRKAHTKKVTKKS